MRPDDPRHGTTAGYVAHRRAGEQACIPCLDANAADYRRRYAEKYKGTRPKQQRAQHGTDGGYYRHRRGTKTEPPSVPCEACLAAHAAADRARTGAKPLNRKPKPVSKEPRWVQRGLIKVAS